MNIEAVIQSNDLIALAEKAGAELKRSNGEWRSACPLHTGHNDTGFVIYNDHGKQKWTCYSGDCGGGDVIDFVMTWQKRDFAGAIRYLGGDKQELSDAEKAQIATERQRRAEQREREKWAEYQQALTELRSARRWAQYYDYLVNHPEARTLWMQRGIPDVWQDLWQLGYCESFHYKTGDTLYTSPSLAIPIYDGKDQEPVNIRHRILNPVDPADKYRPERRNLHGQPFICDPENDNQLEQVLVCEGEIKSMVTYITLDNPHLQVYGIPGKKYFSDLIPRLQGRSVVICYDPDGEEQARKAAQAVNGRIITLQVKIDDAINARVLDKNALRLLLKQARKV